MKNTLWVIVFFLSMCFLLADSASASEAPAVKPDVEKTYKSCAVGYYSGPREGRVRCTKDPWVWVVSPEFAENFCFPKEMVSTQLKGAEAIAFKIDENRDEESCGWGGQTELCNVQKFLKFEIYIKSSAKLPKLRDVTYFHVADLPSGYLISKSRSTMSAILRGTGSTPHPGAMGVFDTSEIGLIGVKDDRAQWPITTLYNDIFYGEAFPGIDYISAKGLTGFFTNPRMESQNISKFIIGFNRIEDKSLSNVGKPLADFGHIIELPTEFLEKVREADKKYGFHPEEFGKQALGISPKK